MRGEGLSRSILSRGPDLPVPFDRRRFYQVVAILAAASAYATIILGGTVRGMGAGLACPDWPLCHGSVIPDVRDPLVAVEYAHRLAAALTSLCLLLTFVLALLWYRRELRLVTLTGLGLAILVAQVAFGALTITSSLDPVVVTIHLALGAATFGIAIMVALLRLWSPTAPRMNAASP
jgi:cytochrome c oxidase assembly protein subunit 15